MPDSGERDDVEGTAPSWPMANDESEAALRRDAPHTRLATVSATLWSAPVEIPIGERFRIVSSVPAKRCNSQI